MNEETKRKKCTIGLALYNFDWIASTGTQTIGQELARNLIQLKQPLIEYKILLKQGVPAAAVGLPEEYCLNAPGPDYRFSSKVKSKLQYFFYENFNVTRSFFNIDPYLSYLGDQSIKAWLHSLGMDLLYYPTMWQWELITDIPIVVQLFDMQHIHLHFLDFDTFQREKVFGWYAKHASLITCNFEFVAKDIKENLNVGQEKIGTIFLAPPKAPKIDQNYTRSIREKFLLPEHYFIYPAATWPHKNHINLIKALSKCISSGLEIYCVCPGENSDRLYPGQFQKIREAVKEYKVEKNIYFIGNVTHVESLALIDQADFLCMPSLYEAGCYSIWEAFICGKAVAGSEVTMIPHQVRDAGLLFNPYDPSDIAKAITLLHLDRKLRADLGKKARELINDEYYRPEKTVLGYHRAFVNTLVNLGKLAPESRIQDDPAPALDRQARPPKFEWRHLLN